MSLYSKNKDPLIAKEDIICYITLAIGYSILHPTTKYYLGFFDKEVNVNEPFIMYGPKPKPLFINSNYIIDDGFIHTYSNKDDAARLAKSTIGYNVAIFKCIIPKGSIYYEGPCYKYNSEVNKIINETNRSYCSRKIIFCEKVFETHEKYS